MKVATIETVFVCSAEQTGFGLIVLISGTQKLLDLNI